MTTILNTALVIIDMLEGFFVGGRLANHRTKLVGSINELIEEARKSSLPIIWVRQEYKKDLSDAPLFNRKQNKLPTTLEGSKDSEILNELHYRESDVVIVKKRFSAFFNTDFEEILEKYNIDRLIITGVNTMTCVRVTAIDAYQRDYEVILALDCVDAYDVEQHDNSIKYLQYSVSEGRDNKDGSRLV